MENGEWDARTDRLLDRISRAPLVPEYEIDILMRSVGTITPAERRALVCLSHGMSYKMVADTLGVELETVKTQLRVARYKLRAKNTTHAVAQALRLGLID